MTLLDRYPCQRADAAARIVDGEAVVVTPHDSQVHELNEVATFVWSRCDGRASGQQLVDAVVEAFEVDRADAARDVAELLAALERKGLIDLSDTPRT